MNSNGNETFEQIKKHHRKSFSIRVGDQFDSPFSKDPYFPISSSTDNSSVYNLDTFKIYPQLQTQLQTLPIRPSIYQGSNHLKRFSDGQIKLPNLSSISDSSLGSSLSRKESIESMMDSGFYSPLHNGKNTFHQRSISHFDLFPIHQHTRQDSCDSFYSLTSSIPDTSLSDIVRGNEPFPYLDIQPLTTSALYQKGTESIHQSLSKTCIEEDEGSSSEMICHWNDCGMKFQGIPLLVSHISLDHIGSGKSSYLCEWAGCSRIGKPFIKRHKLTNHVRIHTGERPFACIWPDCGKKFARRDALGTHVRIHAQAKPFECTFPNCDKSYLHPRSLKKHLVSHTLTHTLDSGVPNVDLEWPLHPSDLLLDEGFDLLENL